MSHFMKASADVWSYASLKSIYLSAATENGKLEEEMRNSGNMVATTTLKFVSHYNSSYRAYKY